MDPHARPCVLLRRPSAQHGLAPRSYPDDRPARRHRHLVLQGLQWLRLPRPDIYALFDRTYPIPAHLRLQCLAATTIAALAAMIFLLLKRGRGKLDGGSADHACRGTGFPARARSPREPVIVTFPRKTPLISQLFPIAPNPPRAVRFTPVHPTRPGPRHRPARAKPLSHGGPTWTCNPTSIASTSHYHLTEHAARSSPPSPSPRSGGTVSGHRVIKPVLVEADGHMVLYRPLPASDRIDLEALRDNLEVGAPSASPTRPPLREGLQGLRARPPSPRSAPSSASPRSPTNPSSPQRQRHLPGRHPPPHHHHLHGRLPPPRPARHRPLHHPRVSRQ